MESLVQAIASSENADDVATLYEANLDMMFSQASIESQNNYESKLQGLQGEYQTEALKIGDPNQPYILAKDWSKIQDVENAENAVSGQISGSVAVVNSTVEGLSQDEGTEVQSLESLGAFCNYLQNLISRFG